MGGWTLRFYFPSSLTEDKQIKLFLCASVNFTTEILKPPQHPTWIIQLLTFRSQPTPPPSRSTSIWLFIWILQKRDKENYTSLESFIKTFPCLWKIKFNRGNFSRRRKLAKPNLRFHLRRYELTTEENFKILYNLILFGVLITFLRFKTFVFNKKKYTWQFHHLRHLFQCFYYFSLSCSC